jgi:hypothetical protein
MQGNTTNIYASLQQIKQFCTAGDYKNALSIFATSPHNMSATTLITSLRNTHEKYLIPKVYQILCKSQLPDLGVMRALITAYKCNNDYQQILALIEDMKKETLLLNDDVCFGGLATACRVKYSHKCAHTLLELWQTKNFAFKTPSLHALQLIIAFGEDTNSALSVYKQSCKSCIPNNQLIGALITALYRNKEYQKCIDLVDDMLRYNTMPQTQVLGMLATSFANVGGLPTAKKILQVIQNPIVQQYADDVHFLQIIKGLVVDTTLTESQLTSTVQILDIMKKTKVQPSGQIFSLLLSACSRLRLLTLGEHVYNRMKTMGVSEDLFIGASMLQLYAECGDVTKVEVVFASLLKKYSQLDIACYNSKLSAYPTVVWKII